MLNEISIEIIRKCPNNCLHCSSMSSIQCEERMPLEKFKEIVSGAVKLGVKTICLSGGEPFLHDEIKEMVLFVHQCGLKCYIYTSGIALNSIGEFVSLPVDVLNVISCSVTKIIFNIEAGTEETYNKIMGTQGCFEKMQRSAIRAAEAGICTEAHFVPMALNINEIHQVINLCKKIQVKKISFLRLVLHGRAKTNRAVLEIMPEEYGVLKEQLYAISEQMKFSTRIGVPLSQDVTCHKCEAANGKLNIKYDGKVYPCEVFKNYSMKTTLKGLEPDCIYEDTLINIYNNSEYLKCVRRFSQNFAKSSQCETCVGQYLIEIEERCRE